MIGLDGQAMICDFGCARAEMASQSIAAPTSTLKGTCHYWAPELLDFNGKGTKMSKQSDVWAFGMTIYVRTLIISQYLLNLLVDANGSSSPISKHLPACHTTGYSGGNSSRFCGRRHAIARSEHYLLEVDYLSMLEPRHRQTSRHGDDNGGSR